ncbi:uncharacterized protein LOC144448066 [Glandiceps talaboti]
MIQTALIHHTLQDFLGQLFPFSGTLNNLNRMVERSGFIIHKSYLELLTFKLGSKEHHKGYLKPLLGHLDYIPLELHDEFMEDVYQVFYSLAPKDEDGNPYWRNYVVFLKLEK